MLLKGGEAENVILLTDISNRIYKSFQSNPDDESSVLRWTNKSKGELVFN